MEDKFFTLKEVGQYLKIPKSTLYKLVQKGQIPCSKIGKQLRFRKSSLDKWLTEKENRLAHQVFAPLPPIDKNKLSLQKPKHILLIDDDELILKTLNKFLNLYNYNVKLAKSGEEALKKIEEENLKFDLVIADVRMPGMDGLETLKRIRDFYNNSNQPPAAEILITGYIDPQAEAQAQGLGISDYLHKPFSTTDFINRVKKKLEI